MTDNATPMPGTVGVRNHIPMDYLERHPGDLEAAMRDYAEDRWKLIDRLKQARAALETVLEESNQPHLRDIARTALTIAGGRNG